jgi:hypothetical protein
MGSCATDRDTSMTCNLGVDSRPCVANWGSSRRARPAKTHMASVFPGLCAIAAHSDRGIFIKLQVSHEFSRGVVFKLIAGWGRDIVTVSVALSKVMGKSIRILSFI